METQNYTVYRHISPSGKIYVGITSRDVKLRWRDNGLGYLNRQPNGSFVHPYFANAILKYSWNNIKHEILHTNLTKEEACKLEVQYVAEHKKLGLSYNITDGGEGHSSVTSPETILKLKESHKGIKQSQETIQKRVSKIIGKTRTPEQNMKTSKPIEQYSKDGT